LGVAAEGLYDPALEKDLRRRTSSPKSQVAFKSHQSSRRESGILCNLEHSGAVGADRAPATARD